MLKAVILCVATFGEFNISFDNDMFTISSPSFFGKSALSISDIKSNFIEKGVVSSVFYDFLDLPIIDKLG